MKSLVIITRVENVFAYSAYFAVNLRLPLINTAASARCKLAPYEELFQTVSVETSLFPLVPLVPLVLCPYGDRSLLSAVSVTMLLATLTLVSLGGGYGPAATSTRTGVKAG